MAPPGSERSDAKHEIEIPSFWVQYALTVTYLPTYHKGTKYPVTNNERKHYLSDVIDMLTDKGYILQNINWETGKNDKLHLHCIVNTPIRVYPYPKKPNFRLHWVRMYDKVGWGNYITKEKTTAYQQKQVEKYFLKPENFIFTNL